MSEGKRNYKVLEHDETQSLAPMAVRDKHRQSTRPGVGAAAHLRHQPSKSQVGWLQSIVWQLAWQLSTG